MKRLTVFSVTAILVLSALVFAVLSAGNNGLVSVKAHSVAVVPTEPKSDQNSHLPSEYAASITPVTNPQDAERIPEYPNPSEGSLKSVSSQFYNQPSGLSFYTDDSVEEVEAYYTAVLQKLGWLSDGRNSGYGAVNLLFTWSDTDGKDPYRLILPLSILDTCWEDPYAQHGDDTSRVYKRCVIIELFRKPHASRIPLSQDAVDIRSVDTPTEHWPHFLTRTTEYTTSSTPAEVQAFYVEDLQRYGWVLGSVLNREAPDSIENGIRFQDPTTDILHTEPPEAVISAQTNKDGRTQVTLVLKGPELTDWPEK